MTVPNGRPSASAVVLQRQADVEVQGDERPLIGRQELEAPLELVLVRQEPSRGRASPMSSDVTCMLQVVPAPRTSCFAIARVHEDAADPSLEAVGVAEPAKVAPAGDQRLLGRIVRALGITQDQAGDGV